VALVVPSDGNVAGQCDPVAVRVEQIGGAVDLVPVALIVDEVGTGVAEIDAVRDEKDVANDARGEDVIGQPLLEDGPGDVDRIGHLRAAEDVGAGLGRLFDGASSTSSSDSITRPA